MKCSACGEQWFQLPDPDELIEDLEQQIEEDEGGASSSEEGSAETPVLDDEGADNKTSAPQEDIPEGVKPDNLERSKAPVIQDEGAGEKNIANLAGYGAAAFIFILAFALLVAMKDTVIRSWPASISFYHMIGLHAVAPGEDLVFDRIEVSVSEEFVTVDGLIINLSNESRMIPTLEARLKDGNAQDIAVWHIAPPQMDIGPESTVPFKAQHAMDASAGESLQIRFVLDGKAEHMTPVEK